MTAVVYLGAVPSSTNVVSEGLLSKGISLLRDSPSELSLYGVRAYTHIAYERYLNNLPAAVHAANTNTVVPFDDLSGYFPLAEKKRAPFCGNPQVVWAYEEKSSEAVEKIMSDVGAVSSTAGGKPALLAFLSPDQLKEVLKTGPNEDVPFSVNNINIAGYKVYLKLHAVFHCLARLHQYPLIVAGTTNLDNGWTRSLWLSKDALAEMSAKDFLYVQAKTKATSMFINLPSPYHAHNYTISAKADLPNDSGLIVPYVEELAKDDHFTIPNMFSGPLFKMLGESAPQSHAALQIIVDGWKTLKITSWGKELSHMFTGLRLAFESGAGYRVLGTSEGRYGGFILSGAYFSLSMAGVVYDSVPFAQLQTAWDVASPHTQALAAVYAQISFPSDMERAGALGACTCLYDVSKDIRTHGYNANNLLAMKEQLRRVAFAKDRLLQMSTSNITRILNCITSADGDENIPMHAVAVFSNNRGHRLLSAFGPVAPSFRVDGGRTIPLTGNFTFSKKTAKGVKDVSVVTMYVAMKPWEKACEDLDLCILNKDVLSPAGTPLAGRASSRSLIRAYEGNGGVQILGALRRVCGVVISEGSGGSKKRKNEDGSSGSQKKAKVDFDDF